MSEKKSLDDKLTASSESLTNPPHDLKGLLKAKPILEPSEVIGLGFFLLLSVLLLIALIRLFNRRKDSRKTIAGTSDKSIVINGPSLLMQINELALPLEEHTTDEEKLSDWTRFSSGASVILRRAVEFRTKLPVAERTTDEIYHIFSDSDIFLQGVPRGELIELLRSLDEITFAGRVSSVSDAANLLARVKVSIRDLTASDLQSPDLSVAAGDGVKIFE